MVKIAITFLILLNTRTQDKNSTLIVLGDQVKLLVSQK